MEKLTMGVLALVLVTVSAALFFSFQNQTPTITNLNPAEFANLIESGDVFIVDTHIPEQEHIAGTDAFLPYNELGAFASKLPPDKNKPIAVYCRSGSMSAEAAQTLQEMGYTRVYNLVGGVNAWKAENRPMSSYKFDSPDSISLKAIVFKSPNCGCCTGYISELERSGFEVETVLKRDLSGIKAQYGVPAHLESCHTAVIGNYFIEGHVPLEAVMKLLKEKPAIDGIALEGMPSGSPGMPGIKLGDFTIYAINGEEISVFTTI